MSRRALLLALPFILGVPGNPLEAQEDKASFYSFQVGLVTDAATYLTGDTLWFIVSPSPALPTDSLSVRVELLNPYGSLSGARLILLTNAARRGYLVIADTCSDGPYQLRAYPVFGDLSPGPATVRYLQVINPDNDYWDDRAFRKHLKTIRRGLGITDDLNVFIWPEGGNWTGIQGQRVAVRILDEKAMPVQDEWTVTPGDIGFRTDRRGWGSFQLGADDPRELTFTSGLHGKARVKPDIDRQDVSLGLSGTPAGDISVRVMIPGGSRHPMPFRVVGVRPGSTFFEQEYLPGGDSLIVIPAGSLPGDWFSVMLTDSRGKVLSERYVPAWLAGQQVSIETSEKDLLVSSGTGQSLVSVEYIPAGDSLAVQDPWVSLWAERTTLRSLREALYDPSAMTSGPFSDMASKSPGNTAAYVPGVSGRVTRDIFQFPVRGATVALYSLDDYFTHWEARTDADGRFSFSLPNATDSMALIIEVRNRKGRKAYLVSIDQVMYEIPGMDIPMLAWYHDKTEGRPARNEWKPDSIHGYPGAIHRNADYVLHFDEQDASRYSSVFQMIEGRVPGVGFMGYGQDRHPVLRGPGSIYGSNEPLYLLDGVPVSRLTLNAINPQEVERIEILKSGGSSAIYGIRGGNGVIAVYTRTGMRIAHGELQFHLIGYHAAASMVRPADPRLGGRQLIWFGPAPESGEVEVALPPRTGEALVRVRVFDAGGGMIDEQVLPW